MAWKFARFAHWRIWLTVAATLIPLTAVTRPATADTTVTCAYTVTSSWGAGFTANVDITNNGPAINGWTLQWTFITPTSDIEGWLAVIAEQGGYRATARNLSWNGTIPTGATASFGWNAKANSTAVPTDLTINGEPC
jgi:cellulase/cellobiase CelA1